MNRTRVASLIGAVVIATGAAAWWWKGSARKSVAAPPAAAATPRLKGLFDPVVLSSPRFVRRAANDAPAAGVSEEAPAWEQQVEQALSAMPGDDEKAALLLQLLPGLPEEALATAAEAATSRLSDAHHAAALPLLLDPQTHGAILSVLFADLMERPDPIALPALLAIARTPGHPFAASAHDNLELLLGEDLRDDWSAWDEAIRERLTAAAPAAR